MDWIPGGKEKSPVSYKLSITFLGGKKYDHAPLGTESMYVPRFGVGTIDINTKSHKF